MSGSNLSLFFNQINPHDSVILTANQRLAHWMQSAYDNHQKNKHLQGWPSLTILPLSIWITQLWNRLKRQAHLPYRLLDPVEQHVLFWSTMLSTQASKPLTHYSYTAQLACKTWNMLKDFKLPLQALSHHSSEETTLFCQWADHYRILCEDHQRIDQGQLVALLVQHSTYLADRLCQHLYLMGFDHFSPRVMTLFNALKDHYHISSIDALFNQPCSQHLALSIPQREQEFYTMAHWAKQQHYQYPSQTIGCIIPDLAQQTDAVFNAFHEVFYPENTASFNISCGQPLSTYPLIQSAYDLLRLNRTHTPLSLFSRVIRSPFLGGAEEEMLQRAQWDAILRSTHTSDVSLSELLQGSHNSSMWTYCPQLQKHLSAWRAVLSSGKHLQSMQAWLNDFQQQLSALGWPYGRTLNSQEYQAHQRWLKLYTELTRIDSMLPLISYSQALALLHHATRCVIFQPQQSQKANIHILGSLEAAGLFFDQAWLCRMNDDIWPTSPYFNPLIPASLQTQHAFPHTSHEQEHTFCQRITTRIMRCHPNVICSYAKHEREQILTPSSLLPSTCIHTPWEETSYYGLKTTAEAQAGTGQFEHIEDTQGPPLAEDDPLRQGGTQLLTRQSACPFQAFAALRLKAYPLPPFQYALSGALRGHMLHQALALLWIALGNQQALFACDTQQLATIIRKVVQKTLRATQQRYPDILNSFQQQIEEKRLYRILQYSCKKEKERPEFTVQATEKACQLTLGPLKLSMIIDRIDQQSDGRLMIIDYKTHNLPLSPRLWFGERPQQPQLPLYALSQGEHVSGLCWAMVKTGHYQLQGISDLPETGLKSIDSWPDVLAHWRTTLTHLADEFAWGEAAVSPQHPSVCLYCPLKSLCRIR